MRSFPLKHFYLSLFAFGLITPLVFASVSSIRVANPAPVFQDEKGNLVQVSDQGRDQSNPANLGEIISFTATAIDLNADDYYLAICKSDAITPNVNEAPTCKNGAFGISSLTPSGLTATVDYKVDKDAKFKNDWFAFACDRVAENPKCSQANQGLGSDGSPFYVTKSSVALRFGSDCPDLNELEKLTKESALSFLGSEVSIKASDKNKANKKELKINFEESFSRRQLKKWLKDELKNNEDNLINNEFRIVEEELKTLKKSVDVKGNVPSEDEDAIVEKLIQKKEKFKKLSEKNIHFCLVETNDDSLENIVDKLDNQARVLPAYDLEKEGLKINFNSDEKRSITFDFRQKEVEVLPVAEANSTNPISFKSQEEKTLLTASEIQVKKIKVEQDKVEDDFKSIVIKHEVVPEEERGLLSQLFGGPQDPVSSSDTTFEMNVLDSVVTNDATEDEIIYQSADNRKTDTYRYKNNPTSVISHQIKNYTLYHFGYGKEVELYSFENTVLHKRSDGVIEGYYVPGINLSDQEGVVSSELINRASATLNQDVIDELFQNGKSEPDFIIPAPFAIDKDGNVLDDLTYEIVGDQHHQLKVSFTAEVADYPLVLDPSIQFTAPGSSNTGDTITGDTANDRFSFLPVSGDFNSDGRDDLAVGAYTHNSDQGRVYIFYNNGDYSSLASGADVIIEGEASSRFGLYPIAADLDNDGDDDLAVGAYTYGSNAGRAYVFYNDGAYPTSASSADVIIDGEASSYFGFFLDSGDLNSDGTEDLAIGASLYSSQQGRAYVFYNIDNGTDGDFGIFNDDACLATSCLASNADEIITGINASDNFGISLTIGDIDSDGNDDLMVGASGSLSGANAGAVYIFYNDGAYASTASSADVTIAGEASSEFGYFLKSGDLDADGDDDLVVSGPGYNSNQGRVYILYNDGSIPTTAATANVIITGETSSDFFGESFGLSDMNSDGRLDLIVGAYGYSSSTGRLYTFYNGESYPSTADNANSIITGETTGDAFGSHMTFADFNSDGASDMFVGATNYSGNKGRGYIFYGQAPLKERDGLIGENNTDEYGYVMVTGDIDSDGLDDLVVGAPGVNSDDGQIYIFYSDGNTLDTLSADDTITGISSGADFFGAAIAIGDVDADGDNDLLVAAPSTANGTVYVFENDGSFPSGAASADDVIDGVAASDAFGTAIAMGDIDGDGDDDIIIGAPSATNGTAYIFYNTRVSLPVYADASSADDVVDGVASGDQFGSLILVHDIDQDNDSDLIISAANTTNGTVYIFDNDGVAFPDASSADDTLAGVGSGDKFGSSIAIGDVDRDNDPDLIIGAPNTSNGNVYIFYNDGSAYPDAGSSDDGLAGEGSGDLFGKSIGFKDIDDDGFDDLIVGASNTTNGKVYVFYNTGSTYPDAVGADIFIEGDSSSANFGANIVLADLNGDRINDLLVADPDYTTSKGRIHSFYGSSEYSWNTVYPWQNFIDGAYNGGNRHQIEGLSDASLLGYSMASADINGDGKNDLVVGAPGYNSNTGRVYLFLSDGSFSLNTLGADVIIDGSAVDDDFGYSLAIGEVSNSSDGILDLLIGAPGANSDDGAVYLYNGQADWSSTTLYSDADITLTGVSSGADRFGEVIVADADLSPTPDARDDLVISAPSTTNGTVYLFENDGTLPTTAATADITLTGAGSGDQFGKSIATGEVSVSADYRTDLIIGAPNTTNGNVYIFYNDGSYGTSDVTLSGENSGDAFGTSIAVAELSNTRDIRKDIVVGAPNHTTDQGRVYIFYNDGSAYGASDTTFDGASGDNAGTTLAVADLNRDGRVDLAIGKPGYNTEEGRVEIFYNDGSLASDEILLNNTGSNSKFGSALLATDLDNNGWTELSIGSNGTYSDRGSVFINDFNTLHLAGASSTSYGQSLAIGDYDGDGDNDLAIGQPGYSSSTGRVYIFFENFNGLTKQQTADASVTITGSAAGDEFGFALASGEVSATPDNIDDLIIGAPGVTSDDGEIRIFEGRSNWSSINSASHSDDVIAGVTSGVDRFGSSIIANADLSTTPDGRDDIVVGAPDTANGSAYLFYNDNDYPSIASSADVTLNGESSGDQFGYSLATGQLSSVSDNRIDLLVGAPSYSSDTGRAYVFYNDGAYGSADVTFTGDTSSRFGTALATGDLDGDGDADVLIGGPEYSTNLGRAYLFYNDGSYGSVDDTIDGETNAYFAQSVAIGEFDINNEPDLLIGHDSGHYIYFNDGSYPTACCTTYDVYIGDGLTSYTTAPRQLLVGDLTGDGKDDFIAGIPGYSSSTGEVIFHQGVDIQCEPPSVSTLTISDTSGFTSSTTPILSLAYTGGSSIPDEAIFSCDGGLNWSSPLSVSGSSSPVTVTTFDITTGATGCSAGDGSKTITTKLKNSCGYSPDNLVSDITYLDSTGPTITVFSAVNDSATQITVTADTITDGTGAEDPYQYQFSGAVCEGALGEKEFTLDDDNDDVFTGLTANTQYGFRVRARDELGNQGDYTACGALTYTSADVPGAPLAFNPAANSFDVTAVSGGAEEEVAIYIEEGAVTCDGVEGDGYVQIAGDVDVSEEWQTVANWANTTVTGLTTGIQYSVCVKARNGDDDETAFGSTTIAATSADPTLISYTANDAPAPAAAGSDTVTFSVIIEDLNGESDVTNVKGVFFDPSSTGVGNGGEGTADCVANEQNCYIDSSCTLNTAYGDSNQLQADCSVDVWFNANASDWDVQVEVTDSSGVTEFADAGVSVSNSALLGIELTQSTIAYGSVDLGDDSLGQTTSIGNVGNQEIDLYLQGTELTSGANTIPASQQKWHHTSSTFDWDDSGLAGPYALVESSTGNDDETGCLNRDIAVRTNHSSQVETNESIYWKLRMPSNQPVGTYAGSTIFIALPSSFCSAAQSY